MFETKKNASTTGR